MFRLAVKALEKGLDYILLIVQMEHQELSYHWHRLFPTQRGTLLHYLQEESQFDYPERDLSLFQGQLL